MKKILLVFLIIGALSACSNSKEKNIDFSTQIKMLNKTIEMNANILKDIKYENEEIKIELENRRQKFVMMEEYRDMVNRFEKTGTSVMTMNNGLHLTFPNVTSFELSKAILNKNMKIILNSITEKLMVYPKTDIMIKGHTDITGPEKFNQKLSEDRAVAVSKYLMDKGIDSSRMKTIGVGSSESINNNLTKDERRVNRRVDLTIQY